MSFLAQKHHITNAMRSYNTAHQSTTVMKIVRVTVHEGRAPHEHHHLLGDADDDLRGPLLLRKSSRLPGTAGRTFSSMVEQQAGRGADGMRGFPERDQLHAATLARNAIQHHPVQHHAPWRSFRRARAACVAGGRRACLLSRSEVMSLCRCRGQNGLDRFHERPYSAHQ